MGVTFIAISKLVDDAVAVQPSSAQLLRKESVIGPVVTGDPAVDQAIDTVLKHHAAQNTPTAAVKVPKTTVNEAEKGLAKEEKDDIAKKQKFKTSEESKKQKEKLEEKKEELAEKKEEQKEKAAEKKAEKKKEEEAKAQKDKAEKGLAKEEKDDIAKKQKFKTSEESKKQKEKLEE